MVADSLSRLHSDRMDESYLDDNIQACNIKYVEGIFSVHIVESGNDDAVHKPTIDDFIKSSTRMIPVGFQ